MNKYREKYCEENGMSEFNSFNINDYTEFLESELEAINYNRCFKSDSELLVCTYCGIQTNQEPCPYPKKCSSKDKIKAN